VNCFVRPWRSHSRGGVLYEHTFPAPETSNARELVRNWHRLRSKAMRIWLVNHFIQPWRSHSMGEAFPTNLPFPLETSNASKQVHNCIVQTLENISIEIYSVTSLKNPYKGKRVSPKNYVQCYCSTEIKLEVGRIPCRRNRSSLQRFKPVRPISKGFCHFERISPLGGQLIL